MSDIVISVEHLSKLYTIKHRNGDDGLRHAIHDFATAPLRWLSGQMSAVRSQRSENGLSGQISAVRNQKSASANGNGANPPSSDLGPLTSDIAPLISDLRPLTSDLRHPSSEDFWALKDVSFEVKRGEVVGIIGRNGAGKSTLLKILSRITEPTEGRVRIRGRVASLLEVGTGFHPELTGRENIFVNGAILGMSRAEIQKKFDEIVEFSGVEKFLDTPVKRYSSGMHVRLAFAVAAHLEPEILIIDEVLAVGDAEFQKKCLGKMSEVAQGGRTVLFVSHNLAAVESLCSVGMMLCDGALVATRDPHEVIQQYLTRNGETNQEFELLEHEGRVNGHRPVLRKLSIYCLGSGKPGPVRLGSDVHFNLLLISPVPVRYLRVAIRIFNSLGQRVTTCHNDYQHKGVFRVDGPVQVSCVMKNCRLAPGPYSIELQIDDGRTTIDQICNGLWFRVESADIYGTGREMANHAAIFLPEVEWHIIPEVS